MADDADLAWETLDATTAYTCPGFDVVRHDVRLPDGTEAAFHYVSEPPSVVVLPFTADGEVVVIEEWRQAVDRASYGLPAGWLEAGNETPSRRRGGNSPRRPATRPEASSRS
jgi:ADP-ribose pyrophosphatase